MPIVPGVVFAAMAYSPCLASVPGYYLLPECVESNYFIEATKNLEFAIKMFVSTTFVVACATTVAGGVVDLSIGLMTSSYYLTESLYVYMRSAFIFILRYM